MCRLESDKKSEVDWLLSNADWNCCGS